MSQFFELHYHLPEDPARLFDVAQGLAGRRSVLKRGGTVKVKPFTETCRRLLFQCIAFAVLTALAAVLVWAFHAKLKVLFFLCLVMSLVTFWTYQAGRMGYRKSWTQFRKDNRPDGTVTFTTSGIREWNASDHGAVHMGAVGLLHHQPGGHRTDLPPAHAGAAALHAGVREHRGAGPERLRQAGHHLQGLTCFSPAGPPGRNSSQRPVLSIF